MVRFVLKYMCNYPFCPHGHRAAGVGRLPYPFWVARKATKTPKSESRIRAFRATTAPSDAGGLSTGLGSAQTANGTGLSSAIMAASPVAAPSTRAPDHLAAQHARVMRKRA